ncbi:Bug family tripartite tricarboxylate transporter substrate binding protein [Ramlibacter sp.]|uniref:Bug family tripartite tricarboxylate transporter substrate binding protein n=1 Tax=Ramlibacter sp. TaxID=1917967 RepID=UPI003D134058
MRIHRSKRVLSLLIAGLLLGSAAVPAAAQERFPSKPIRVLVGFPPGSAPDISLRALMNVAGRHVGQPLVIVNKPGASQAVAMGELAAAEPDGYTIAMTTDGFLSLTVLQQKMPFDPADIGVLMGYTQFKHVLFVRGDAPFRKYEDYVAQAKSGPGAMDYGASGNGSAPDLLGKIVARHSRLDVTHVNFKGSNEIAQSVLGRHVKSGIVAVSGLAPQLKDGSLGIVLVFGEERLPEYPDVPTAEEKGIRNTAPFNSVLVLALPRKTPADRVKVLHDALRKAVEDPDFRKAVEPTGLMPKYFSPSDMSRLMSQGRDVGVPLLRELKLLAN